MVNSCRTKHLQSELDKLHYCSRVDARHSDLGNCCPDPTKESANHAKKKTLRLSTDYPWYVSNSTLPKDLNLAVAEDQIAYTYAAAQKVAPQPFASREFTAH